MPKTPSKNQSSLFSFFSKKPKSTPPAPKPRPTNDPSNPPPPTLSVGTRLLVYWDEDDKFYPCVIDRRFEERVRLVYDDGDVETCRLEDEIWRLEKKDDNNDEKSDGEKSDGKRENDAKDVASKRRRIEESDESAMEEDDDESFKMDAEEDDESFHADEEEEEVEQKKPPAKKQLPKKAPSNSPKVTLLSPTGKPKQISPTPLKHPRSTPTNLPSTQLNPPHPIPNELNPPGSHLHNHLLFFSQRHDLNGHPSNHPSYDPSHMRIDWNELERVSKQLGTTLSPAQRQWWQIKSSYANCILLFKTGKFYEMFHDDADVASSVLGHAYMKGILAHGGFPEAGYKSFIGRLVERGYRVARVEQTESPGELAERKKMTKGKKPGVVCREVCGVVSRGTRTYCFLDDASALENDGAHSTGPLIVIKETLIQEATDAMDQDSVQAVCEYGVTIVDAVTSTVTLGQFADDVLRSRMQTLLTSFSPSEVLVEGGSNGASKTLTSLIKTACPTATTGAIATKTRFPESTAISLEDRQAFNRPKRDIHPWSVEEAIDEVHRKGYYPRASENATTTEEKIECWPEVLRACIEGGADLVTSSFGAALFYLQSNLVDEEILGMGLVKAYIPPNSGSAGATNSPQGPDLLQNLHQRKAREEGGLDVEETHQDPAAMEEDTIDHMALDGTTLNNLEILHNMSSGGYQGSLLSKIDFTKSPHGSRLLKAWLLRPMFIKSEIDRRADAVAELSSGSAAMAMGEARDLLKKTGDIERLLSRVHSMSGGEGNSRHHPAQREILYENAMHNKKKVEHFSKLLSGLKAAAGIPEIFDGISIESPLLAKLVRTTDDGGYMPSDLHEKLDWFIENFDLKKAARGEFEPVPGMNDDYDNACQAIENIERELDQFKKEMTAFIGQGSKSAWKYINMKEDSKDKFLIELPASIAVPEEFTVKAKRGKGSNQVNKYRCPEVARMVEHLENAISVKKDGKSMGMKLVFAKFDSMRETWQAAMLATSMLDAIGSLAFLAAQPGFCRPNIVDCPPDKKPGIKIVQGRHPCVDVTHSGGSFIPNDLTLGGSVEGDSDGSNEAPILLLSGPNMGGKSTLLRQTCLITILAQIGSFVPAEECSLTPVDRIFTRLGASDRILCGQSTFFVELAETAAAVRGASRRSLVIMDELGRGTSTFDGTAIASATLKHLVERNKCLTMFATHYHSLLEDWKHDRSIRLGHMECIVEDDSSENASDSNITFLYTLGDGPCPNSFGVNVARLAGLPDDVLRRAKKISTAFEAEMNGEANHHKIIPSTATSIVSNVMSSFSGDSLTGFDRLQEIWESLQ